MEVTLVRDGSGPSEVLAMGSVAFVIAKAKGKASSTSIGCHDW